MAIIRSLVNLSMTTRFNGAANVPDQTCTVWGVNTATIGIKHT